MIESRFYDVKGVKWEARFFKKNEEFPESAGKASRQGIWGKPEGETWEDSRFIAPSWALVDMETAVKYFPERGPRRDAGSGERLQ